MRGAKPHALAECMSCINSIIIIQLSREDLDSVEKKRLFNIFRVQLDFKGDVDSENFSHTFQLVGVEPADIGIVITRDRPLTGLNCICIYIKINKVCFVNLCGILGT